MLEYFLDPHPDELLYSVWARYSDQVQYPNQADVARELFGRRSCNAMVEWSCSLGYFIDQLSPDHCYTVDMLINDHTLFPLYAPFLPPERRHLLWEQMVMGNGATFRSRMGIANSHIQGYQWLRYCPECVKCDRERFGETYWHRLHQAPGVEVCPMHDTFLENSTAARQPRRAFVSAERTIQPVIPRSSVGSSLYQLLRDIAETISDLLNHSYPSPESTFFRKQYIALLDQNGFITVNNTLRVVEFLKAFTDEYPPECLARLHCQLSHTRHIEAEWPARLPFARRSQHPLHHILVTRLLGATIESFLCSPIHPTQPFGNGPWPCLNPVCEHYHQLCIPSYSIREKSRKEHPVGIFACTCGFTYSRVGPDTSPEDIFRRDRIPSYGPQWQEKLCELWYDLNISKENIARRLGVDFNTMTRHARKLALPPRPIFQKSFSRKTEVRKDPSEYRKKWLKIVEEHPDEGITALVRQGKQVRTLYNWLNKHDQEWLHSHRPRKKVPQEVKQRNKEQMRTTFRTPNELPEKSSKSERDFIISEAIRATAHQIMNSPGEPRRVTRAQIERAVPIIPWLYRRPNDYPLTMRAFQEVKETREDFALRRIQWTLQRYQEESIKPTRREFILRAKVRRVVESLVVQEAIEEALIVLSRLA